MSMLPTTVPSSRLPLSHLVLLVSLVCLLLPLCPVRSPAATAAGDPSYQSFAFLREIGRAHYPYAHAVLAREIEHLEFAADGSRIDRDDVFITILDDEGKRDNQVLSFYVNRAYARLDIEKVEIIRRGRARAVDIAANSREEAAAANSRANIYNPLERVIKLFLPDLESGDTIHYQVRRRRFKAVITGEIYGSLLAQYDIPVRSYLYTVAVPADRVPEWRIMNAVKHCVKFHRTRLPGSRPQVLLSWHFHDVPMLVPEPDMPSFKRVAMRLAYSTLPDWQAIADWYARLVEPRLQAGPELRRKVAELTTPADGEREKIRALFHFVARRIRYLGTNSEARRPGFEPHDINLTFARRHGVCRDKAALLVGMLRTAGIAAAPVLIQVGDRLDTEIPLPWFNHAIVAVLDRHSQARLFLDPTSETSRQFLPDYERECSCLVAVPRGSHLQLTPPQPPANNLFRIEIQDHLNREGELSGTIAVRCRGFNDTILRAMMMNSTAAARWRRLTGFFLGQSSPLELEGVSWSDPADTATPFTFSGRFHYRARPAPGKPGAFILVPPAFIAAPGPLDRWIPAKADMNRRRYPLKLGYTYRTEIVERMRLPPGLRVTTPTAFELDNQVVGTQLSVQRDNRELRLTRTLEIRKSEVTPEEYPALLALQERNLKLSRTLLHCAPTTIEATTTAAKTGAAGTEPAGTKPPVSNEADIINLAIRKAYRIEKDGTWSLRLDLRRRILTYKGKKDYADFRFPYNRAWQKVKLLKAVTIKADGTRLTSGPKEIHDIPTPWNSEAALYSRERLLVVNLPAVEPGCEIELSLKLESRRGFWCREYFRLEQPVRKKTVSFSLAPGVRLFRQPPARLALNFTRETDGSGRTVYRWQGSDLPALPAESWAPDAVQEGFCLLASTFPDDAAVAAFFRAGIPGFPEIRSRATPPDANRSRARENEIFALYRGLRDRCSVYPLSLLESDLEVQPPELTAEKGYGRDADLALLFWRRLRERGLPARLLLVCEPGSFPERLEQPAFPGWWKHLLVECGGTFFAFHDYQPPSGITGYDGCPALDLACGERLFVHDRRPGVSRTEIELRPATDFSRATGRLRLRLEGAAAAGQRYRWKHRSPEEFRIAAARFLHELAPRAHFLTPLKISGLRQEESPLVFSCDFTLPAPFIPGPGFGESENPGGSEKRQPEFILPLGIPATASDLQYLPRKRVRPLAFRSSQQEERIVTLHLPPGCHPVLLPPELKGRVPHFSWSSHSSWEPKSATLVYRQRVTRSRGLIPPPRKTPDYRQLLNAIRKLTRGENLIFEVRPFFTTAP